MFGTPRPIIVDKSEYAPRRVEMHDEAGFTGIVPSEEHILEAYLHETNGSPRVLDYNYMWLKADTIDYYTENIELALGELSMHETVEVLR